MSLSPERDRLIEIINSPHSSSIRILGAAVSFVKLAGETPFHRELADKIDAMIKLEIKAEQQRRGG